MSSGNNKKTLLAIDFGTKQRWLAFCRAWSSMPLPLGNLTNNGDLRFSLMGTIAEYKIDTVLIGYPNNQAIRTRIDQTIKTLLMMDTWVEVITVDENYTSVQAQATTWATGKHIAHDTLAAIEIINRFLSSTSW